jgi:hypothetical protein
MVKEYFSHDYHARADEKIQRLIIKHGYLGYGVFWALVEELYINNNVMISDFEAIGFRYHVPGEVVKSIVSDFGLFRKTKSKFFSQSIKKRLELREEKSEKARKSALIRHSKYANAQKNDANALRQTSERNANKEKESKVKEKKEDKPFIPPSLLDVKNFFNENNYCAAAAKKAFDYYEAGGWKDGKGNQVRNWKQKMISVWFKPENLIIEQKKQMSIEDQLAANM